MDIRTFFSAKKKSQLDNKNASTVRTKIKRNGVEYFITTNADVQDKMIKRFINSLIDTIETDDEELEEKDSLRRILTACTIVSDEIQKITSSLNSRLDRLDKLDRL